MDELDPQPFRYLKDAFVPVKLAVNDPAQARIRDLLEAIPARAGSDIKGPSINHHAVLGRLEDGIALGVNGGHAMIVFHHVPHFRTVGHAANRAVVARRQDRLFPHNDRTHEFAWTRRARSDDSANVHEILVPRCSLGHGLCF